MAPLPPAPLTSWRPVLVSAGASQRVSRVSVCLMQSESRGSLWGPEQSQRFPHYIVLHTRSQPVTSSRYCQMQRRPPDATGSQRRCSRCGCCSVTRPVLMAVVAPAGLLQHGSGSEDTPMCLCRTGGLVASAIAVWRQARSGQARVSRDDAAQRSMDARNLDSCVLQTTCKWLEAP